jgi:hypothetical protein
MMLSLLNPRALIALAIVGALSFSHFWVYRHGKAIVRAEWIASVAQANAEARQMEQRRQSAVDAAAKSAATRTARNRVDAGHAAGALRGLRDTIAARRMAEESAAACTVRAATLEQLLLESGDALQEMSC